MIIQRKLNSSRGETLVEVLAAVLISALALVMFASMIATSQRLVVRSEKTVEDYYNHVDQSSGNAVIRFNGLAEDTSVTYTVDHVGGKAVIAYTPDEGAP